MKLFGEDVNIYYNSTYVTIKNLEVLVKALETNTIAVYISEQLAEPGRLISTLLRSLRYKVSSTSTVL